MLNFRDGGIKKLEHLCMAGLNSYEKQIIYDFGNDLCFQNEELEDSCICEHYLTDFFCQLRLLKTHKYARK